MLKRAIRKVGRVAWKWLQENESVQREPLRPPLREFSYDWLNRTLLPSILAEGGRFVPIIRGASCMA